MKLKSCMSAAALAAAAFGVWSGEAAFAQAGD